MPMLVAGLLLLWLSSFLLRGFAKANPAALTRLIRRIGGGAALALAFFMLLRGELNVAVVAGGLGLWLLGTAPGALGGLFNTGQASGRARSLRQVRSATLTVVLDATGRTTAGAFHMGPLAGRRLDELDGAELLEAHRWCVRIDPDGARLLEAYLDGRFPGWREAADFAAHPGGAEAGRRDRGAAGSRGTAGMADHEAYDVLGLAQGASREEIARAHRTLMKKYHPDNGGSTDKAARLNQAKDVLMRRHPQTRYTQ